jgi:hypothetical protein
MASPGMSVEVDHVPGSYEARLVLDTLLPDTIAANARRPPVRTSGASMSRNQGTVADLLDPDGDIIMSTAGSGSQVRSEDMDRSSKPGSRRQPEPSLNGGHGDMDDDEGQSSGEEIGMCSQSCPQGAID